MGELIRVEVCYATAERADRVELAVGADATIGEVIAASGILERHPIDLQRNCVGIFGKLKPLDATVAAGDRIEIYRPLEADAKAARLRRLREKRIRADATSSQTRNTVARPSSIDGS